MTPPTRSGRAYPVEDFLQALTAQLDRAQDALALKVQGTNRPLTWALKDLTIDLRVFIEVDDRGKVLLRSAGPNEDGASTIHLNLTTITRPMVEENSWQFRGEQDLRSLTDLSQTNLDQDDQQRLDWMGVRTVGQLKQLDPMQVQAIVGIPAQRLQSALEAASRPSVTGHDVIQRADGAVLRIRGANLFDGVTPEVHLAGTPVEVLEAAPNQLVVRPGSGHHEGQVEVFTRGERITGWFRMPAPRANGANGHGRNGNGTATAAHAAAPAREGDAS